MSLIKKPDAETLKYISDNYEYDSFGGTINGPNGKDIGESYIYPRTGREIKKINIKGRKYRRYHIVWFLWYGEWPTKQLDHKDGDSLNDLVENLKEVTVKQQLENRFFVKDYRGFFIEKRVQLGKVSWRVRNKKKKIILGHFATREIAEEVLYDYLTTVNQKS